jgi:predicted nucleic acid-binding protein
MTGLDTNILVQLALANHPENFATKAAVQSELQIGSALCVTPGIMAEFLHVATDTRRFIDAMTMTEALDWMDEFLANTNSVTVLSMTEASSKQAMAWMRVFQLGRKRILDTNLAAAIYIAGGRRILSSNPEDFKVFRVFEVICP